MNENGRKKYYVTLKNETDPINTHETGGSHRSSRKHRDLNEAAINWYIDEVEKRGISYECELSIKGGTKVNAYTDVIIIVFRAGDYRICEAVGQKNNRTYLLRGDTSTDELVDILSTTSTNLQGLAKQGMAAPLNHLTGDRGEYSFNPNRILAIAQQMALTQENEELGSNVAATTIANKMDGRLRNAGITLDGLQQVIMEQVAPEEVGEATTYIQQIDEIAKIFKKDASLLRDYLSIGLYSILDKQGEGVGLSGTQLENRIATLQYLKGLKDENKMEKDK